MVIFVVVLHREPKLLQLGLGTLICCSCDDFLVCLFVFCKFFFVWRLITNIYGRAEMLKEEYEILVCWVFVCLFLYLFILFSNIANTLNTVNIFLYVSLFICLFSSIANILNTVNIFGMFVSFFICLFSNIANTLNAVNTFSTLIWA